MRSPGGVGRVEVLGRPSVLGTDAVGVFGGSSKLETSQTGRRGRHEASGPETFERVLGFEPFPMLGGWGHPS